MAEQQVGGSTALSLIGGDLDNPCGSELCCAVKNDAICVAGKNVVGVKTSCKPTCAAGESSVAAAIGGAEPCANGVCCAAAPSIALSAPASTQGTQTNPAGVSAGAAGGAAGASSDYGLLKPMGERTIPQIIGGIIKFLGGLAGSLFFFYLIWGGAQWMLSAGDDAAVKKARGKIMNAVFGIAIVVFSYYILEAVMQVIVMPAGV